jgi:serine/threonine protein kinase/tetratricopeptide (TPR) repeat protein
VSSDFGKQGDRGIGTSDRLPSPDPQALTPGPARPPSGLASQYDIERELGRGGTAIVYLATRRGSTGVVALKLLRPELSRAVGESRFHREIRIAGALDHPNILALLETGAADGQLFYTMPFIDGETLRARIGREKQLHVKAVLTISRDVANGLDYAHSQAIVHRDIKPANILLGTKHTVIADFGIARLMSTDSGDTLTDSGVAVGTPEYMSPEQAGEQPLDARSDVYALGCVVYEMLAGEPPFTGPTPQAIIARHCQEAPRSIRVIRPSIPQAAEAAVLRALAKVPADRFESAGAFVDALEAGFSSQTDVFGLARLTRRTRTAIAGGLAITIALIAWGALAWRQPTLDVNRVVVFPLHDGSSPTTAIGEEVATFVGYRLAEARPLQWREGWELLPSKDRESRGRIDAATARALSRHDRAAHYIDGSIIRRSDSVTVFLRLVSVAGDSVIRTEGRTAHSAAASVHQLGLDVVQSLLPDLVSPGGRIDRSSLSQRDAGAVANFLQGEREYRRMQFRAALPHYQAAVAADSAFALAAMRGAYTASWLSEAPLALALVRTAESNATELPLAHQLVTHGLRSYLEGNADAAIDYLRRALRADSTVHGAWTLLGEVYSRLLPSRWDSDSLARAALEHARALDPDFAPTLLLLEEYALRDGDRSRMRELSTALRRAGADTTHEAARRIMQACVEGGPATVNWRDATVRNSSAVISASKVLGGGAAHPQCSIAGFGALLAAPTTTSGARLGFFTAVHAQLAAAGQGAEAEQLLVWQTRAHDLRAAKMIVAIANKSAYQADARRYADSVAAAIDKAPSLSLWLTGLYEFDANNLQRVEAIGRALRHRADSSATALSVRLARSVEARRLTMRGDTVGAIAVLSSLSASGARSGIIWYLWESLAPDRMLLARLQFANGEVEAARRTATFIDATEPMTNPFFLRESLELRARAAETLGLSDLKDIYVARLRRLSED